MARQSRQAIRGRAVINLPLYGGVALACVAMLMGYRTAMVLLASLGVSFAVPAAGIPFTLWAWLALDLAVMALVVRPVMTLPDKLIVALFPAAWAAYFMPSPIHYWGAYAVVCVQFLLCAPFLWTQRGRWQVSHGPSRELKYEAA